MEPAARLLSGRRRSRRFAPRRATHYNVAVLGVPCLAWGERRMFSAFQWSDRDWLVILSWFLGSCSKLAVIEESAVHPLLLDADGHDDEMAIVRTVSRNGEQIMRMEFAPQAPIELEDLSFYLENLPLICMRHVPDCHVPPLGRPLVHDLTEMVMTDVRLGQALRGPATLRFCAADNEEMLPLQPREVLGGYRLPMGFALQGVRILHDYLQQAAKRRRLMSKVWSNGAHLWYRLKGEGDPVLTLIGGFALVDRQFEFCDPHLGRAAPHSALALTEAWARPTGP